MNTADRVTKYIDGMPKEAQAKLRQMRACVKKSAPRAVEDLKWSMPSLSYKRILVMYGGFKKHIGFYPTPSAIRAYKKELEKEGLNVTKGSIQFPLDRPLPLALIRKITAFRVRESIEQDGKWKTAATKKTVR